MVKINKKGKSDELRGKKVIKKVLNPFEVHVNKEKLRVLGRKNKNDRGLPGIARAKAIKKRKNTLGHEYSLCHKSNKFVDRRIGERNSSMTSEDRITARFSAVQQRLHKNKQNIYNLEDTTLTHRGQTLSEIEKFEDPRSEDELSEDEIGKRGDGKLEANFVSDAHFGGGLFKKSGEGVKSRKDLIEQLIIESKKRKLEKQKQREATIEMTEKLDSEWKDLLPLVNKSQTSKAQETLPKSDDYDIVMRQLKFEARGTPSDRLKSEDEIAKEEKQRLEKLENDRLARMNCGTDDKTTKNKHRSADDLDDGLDIEAEPDFTLKYDDDGNLVNSAQILEKKDENSEKNEDASNSEQENMEENESDEDDDGDNDSLSDLKADTSSDELSEIEETNNDVKKIHNNLEPCISPTQQEQCGTSKGNGVEKLEDMKHSQIHDDNLKMNNEGTNVNERYVKDSTSKCVPDEKLSNKIKIDLMNRKKVMEQAAKELPYTFKMPNNYEELEQLLSKHPPDHQSIIIERMIKCNHPSLCENNKEKLGNLLAYLLQYINDIFLDTSSMSVQEKFMLLDRLTPGIYDLCQMNPANAYICFIEVIKEKQNDFRKYKRTFPGLDTLIFFKLVSLLFPTSDYRHQVVTPTLVFMSQLLSTCKVRSKTDIATGLFLVTLILEYCQLSKRMLPAALNFLSGIIHMTIPKNSIQFLKVIPPFKFRGSDSSLLVLNESITEIPENCHLIMDSTDFVSGELDEICKIRIFYISLKLLAGYINHLQASSASEMIFAPHMHLLELVPINNYPQKIKLQYDKTYALIQKCKDSMMDYLQLEKARPKALRLYEPNIEKILYDTKRHRPMSKEKADHEKLLHKYKREMKGALREIRRDKSYLAGLQIKKQIASDMERKAKVKQIYAEAAIQQGELNSLKRKK